MIYGTDWWQYKVHSKEPYHCSVIYHAPIYIKAHCGWENRVLSVKITTMVSIDWLTWLKLDWISSLSCRMTIINCPACTMWTSSLSSLSPVCLDFKFRHNSCTWRYASNNSFRSCSKGEIKSKVWKLIKSLKTCQKFWEWLIVASLCFFLSVLEAKHCFYHNFRHADLAGSS